MNSMLTYAADTPPMRRTRAVPDQMGSSLRRHARACRAHPRLSCEPSTRKTWMAGTSPAMTPNKWFIMTGIGCSVYHEHPLRCVAEAAQSG